MFLFFFWKATFSVQNHISTLYQQEQWFWSARADQRVHVRLSRDVQSPRSSWALPGPAEVPRAMLTQLG